MPGYFRLLVFLNVIAFIVVAIYIRMEELHQWHFMILMGLADTYPTFSDYVSITNYFKELGFLCILMTICDAIIIVLYKSIIWVAKGFK